ncbi:MAG: hypothetical protein RLZZ435_2238 [Cyanobacteriota bacterium]
MDLLLWCEGMDEDRLKAYVSVIEQLLACPQGQEMALLQRHPDLLDQEFLTVMGQVAQMLRQQGKPNADWLDRVAQGLMMFIADEPIAPDHSLAFFQQTLQVIVSAEGNPQRVYPWLEKHLPSLNLDLLEVMSLLEKQVQNSGQREEQRMFAVALGVFANLLLEFPLGDRSVKLQCARLGYEIAGGLFQSLQELQLSVAAQESLAEVTKKLQNRRS